MSTLTLEAVRRNPWNAVEAELPSNPGPLLLKVAYFATYYCRSSENLLMIAARHGHYTPEGWLSRDDSPDVHEESEARSLSADQRLMEICELYEEEFGEPISF